SSAGLYLPSYGADFNFTIPNEYKNLPTPNCTPALFKASLLSPFSFSTLLSAPTSHFQSHSGFTGLPSELPLSTYIPIPPYNLPSTNLKSDCQFPTPQTLSNWSNNCRASI